MSVSKWTGQLGKTTGWPVHFARDSASAVFNGVVEVHRRQERRGLVIGGVGLYGESPVRARCRPVQGSLFAAAAAPRHRVRAN